MKGIPKQSEGAPARPVQTPWGPRPDVSGDGASPLPEKRIPLPVFNPPKK